jgi:hypothetical protein
MKGALKWGHETTFNHRRKPAFNYGLRRRLCGNQQNQLRAKFNCNATDFASLTEAHFAQIVDLKPEVVLLGTGEKHQFLHPKIYQKLTEIGAPLECMTTAAACRTYNILMSEGRTVAAALLI